MSGNANLDGGAPWSPSACTWGGGCTFVTLTDGTPSAIDESGPRRP